LNDAGTLAPAGARKMSLRKTGFSFMVPFWQHNLRRPDLSGADRPEIQKAVRRRKRNLRASHTFSRFQQDRRILAPIIGSS